MNKPYVCIQTQDSCTGSEDCTHAMWVLLGCQDDKTVTRRRDPVPWTSLLFLQHPLKLRLFQVESEDWVNHRRLKDDKQKCVPKEKTQSNTLKNTAFKKLYPAT